MPTELEAAMVLLEPIIFTVIFGGSRSSARQWIIGPPGVDGADGFSVTGASINSSGRLILTLSAGGPIDAGVAKGADGVSITGAAVNGSGHLILTLSSGGTVDAGLVVGADGVDGDDGVSITGAAVNGSGHLILLLSTGGTVDAGLVVGADGTDGVDGDDGVSVTGATVDGSYHLILTLSTGATIDAGYVRGASGAGTGDVLGPGTVTSGHLATYDGTTGTQLGDLDPLDLPISTATQSALNALDTDKLDISALTGAAGASAGIDAVLALKRGGFVSSKASISNVRDRAATGNGIAHDAAPFAAWMAAGGLGAIAVGDYLMPGAVGTPPAPRVILAEDDATHDGTLFPLAVDIKAPHKEPSATLFLCSARHCRSRRPMDGPS